MITNEPLKKFVLGLLVGSILMFVGIVVYSPFQQNRSETIFVYGTLTNPVIRMYACWCVTELSSATLENYKKVGLNIIPSRNDVVEGAVITVSPSELARIDRYEDTPTNYQRHKIEVGGNQVWVYQK